MAKLHAIRGSGVDLNRIATCHSPPTRNQQKLRISLARRLSMLLSGEYRCCWDCGVAGMALAPAQRSARMAGPRYLSQATATLAEKSQPSICWWAIGWVVPLIKTQCGIRLSPLRARRDG